MGIEATADAGGLYPGAGTLYPVACGDEATADACDAAGQSSGLRTSRPHPLDAAASSRPRATWLGPTRRGEELTIAAGKALSAAV